MSERLVNVVLFGENALLKEGLVRILNSNGFAVVSTPSLLDDASARGLLPRDADVLLVVDATDDFDAAIGKIEPFKENYANGRVVVLVSRQQFHTTGMISAFHRGANAYLINCTVLETLIKVFELVSLGETIIPPAMLCYLLSYKRRHSKRQKDDRQNNCGFNKNGNHCEQDEGGYGEDDDDAISVVSPDDEYNCLPHLSARQTAILRCLIEGDSNKAIARKMRIADATVKVHVKAILRKIRVDNRTQAAIWAIRNSPLILAGHDDVSKTMKLQASEPSGMQVSASS